MTTGKEGFADSLLKRWTLYILSEDTICWLPVTGVIYKYTLVPYGSRLFEPCPKGAEYYKYKLS